MVNTKKSHPNTVSQTSGGKFQTFNNLNNIKSNGNTYAQAEIHGRKEPLNRPSTISVKNFKVGLPTGALATKITVRVKHSKAPKNGKNVNVTAPTISIVNGNNIRKWSDGKNISKKANAPTTTAKETSVTFNVNWNHDILNSSDFGIRIDYPTNANDNEGYIRVYYVQILVEYRTANFGLKINHIGGEYNGDDYTFMISCSNINNVGETPNVTIDAPLGFSLKEYKTLGTFNRVSARTFVWKPKLGVNHGSDTIVISFSSNISYSGSSTSATGTFNAVESIQQHSASKTVTILKDKPVDVTVDPVPNIPPDDPTINNKQASTETQEIVLLHKNQTFYFDLDLPEDISKFKLYCCTVTNGNFADYSLSSLSSVLSVYDESIDAWSWPAVGSIVFEREDFTPTATELSKIAITNKGPYTLVITPKDDSTNILKVIFVDVAPSTTSQPSLSILSLTQEELNRLGHGYNYTLQTHLKLSTSEGYVRDWMKNFRLAVFNNAIESNIINIDIPTEDGYETVVVDSTDYSNLSISQIFENAEYWSDQVTATNQFENLEVKFPYNENYPLYVLLIGDCPEASSLSTSITFTEPAIIEDYNGYVVNGVYPAPIMDLIGDDTTSEININPLSKTDTVIFYDFPLEEHFGTNDEIAIRGLAVQGITDSNTDNLRINTTLVNDKNESKHRSVVLEENDSKNYSDNEFHLGQSGDLWGFKASEIINLEDWEVHFLINNVLNDFAANANIGDIELIVFFEEIIQQTNRCIVEGEDIGYYGAFLQDVNIPEGLDTDVDYTTVNGTDINDPSNQSIKAKTIEVEFSVDGCDLESSTLALKEIKRLLYTKRDKYKRPIPKRLEFTHHPDEYWEYIMISPIDAEVEISGYKCKAKFVVFEGTSFDKQVTSTAETGFISGLASVNPIIQVMPTDSLLSIVENESGQEFNMGYSGDWQGKIVEIDCEDRICWLKQSEDDTDPLNISQYVDINADWFILTGEYAFETVGCAIRTVDWQQRW